MPIQLVGYTAVTSRATTATITVPINSLTGGIASSPAAGDLILVFTGWGSTNNGDPGVSGFFELADLYGNGSNNDTNAAVAYLLAGSTPPTSITVNSVTSTNPKGTLVAVFRGVDPSTPFDAALATLTTTAENNVDPPAAIVGTTGAWAVCATFGAMGTSQITAITAAPSGYTLLGNFSNTTSGSIRLFAGMAYKTGLIASAVENPGTFTVSNPGGAASGGAAFTAILRPMQGNIKFWNGAAWLTKPVKYWNGSAWVTKPVKRWNGSAWVKTNY